MPKIHPFLWFDTEAEEAANFYTSTFRDSRISNVSRYGEAGPGTSGSVLTVTFELEGTEITALNAGPQFKFTEAISLFVDCDTQEEVDEFVGEALRRRTREPMWLAEGQIRPVVADHPQGSW